MRTKTVIFVNNSVQCEFPYEITAHEFRDLDEGCYVYYPHARGTKWYRKDITPWLEEQLPKEIRALALLMS